MADRPVGVAILSALFMFGGCIGFLFGGLILLSGELSAGIASMAVLVGFLLYSLVAMWAGQKLYGMTKTGWYAGVWILGLGIGVSFALPIISGGEASSPGWIGSVIGLVYLYVRKDKFDGKQ